MHIVTFAILLLCLCLHSGSSTAELDNDCFFNCFCDFGQSGDLQAAADICEQQVCRRYNIQQKIVNFNDNVPEPSLVKLNFDDVPDPSLAMALSDSAVDNNCFFDCFCDFGQSGDLESAADICNRQICRYN